MRISDWSSDVCSSDLLARTLLAKTAFQQVRNTVLGGSPGRRPRSAEVPMIIERFDRHTLGRLATELHRQAQDIAEASDVSFADQRAAHPGPENLLKGGRQDRKSTRLNSSHSCASRMPSSA